MKGNLQAVQDMYTRLMAGSRWADPEYCRKKVSMGVFYSIGLDIHKEAIPISSRPWRQPYEQQ